MRRPPGRRGTENRRPTGVPRRQHIAPSVAEPLTVFEQAQFLGGVDENVGVAPDAETAAAFDEARGGKQSIAQVGLGNRAKADNRQTVRQPIGLGIAQVRRVDQAPARIDIGVVQQPFDRATPTPGDAVIDFTQLLGNVNVNRAAGGEREDQGQFIRGHGSQAMWRDADDGIAEAFDCGATCLDELGVGIRRVDKAPLLRARRGPAKA